MKPVPLLKPELLLPELSLPERLAPLKRSKTRRRGVRGDVLVGRAFSLIVYSEEKPNTFRDFGFVWFVRDGDYLRLGSMWGSGVPTEYGDYDERPQMIGGLVPWDGWYDDGNSPYNDLSGWYSPEKDCMFGWVQPTHEEGEHFFWGKPFSFF